MSKKLVYFQISVLQIDTNILFSVICYISNDQKVPQPKPNACPKPKGEIIEMITLKSTQLVNCLDKVEKGNDLEVAQPKLNSYPQKQK